MVFQDIINEMRVKSKRIARGLYIRTVNLSHAYDNDINESL